MQTLLLDLRYAVRQLRKTPGLTTLAVLSLMLGIGANTAIFTIIQSVLLRPLPYAQADRLLFIGPTSDKPGFGSCRCGPDRRVDVPDRCVATNNPSGRVAMAQACLSL